VPQDVTLGTDLRIAYAAADPESTRTFRMNTHRTVSA
jgi:hypothetical protein